MQAAEEGVTWGGGESRASDLPYSLLLLDSPGPVSVLACVWVTVLRTQSVICWQQK